MISWSNPPKTCNFESCPQLKTKLFNCGDFPFLNQILVFLIIEGFSLKSCTTLLSWIFEILTKSMTFGHICEGWSNFCIGTALVKCQLRFKSNTCNGSFYHKLT